MKEKIHRDKYDGCQTDKIIFMELVPEKHANIQTFYILKFCVVQK